MSFPITIQFTCEICGHVWASTSSPNRVSRCPGCNTPYWDGRKKSYEIFRTAIAEELERSDAPMTWTQIKQKANLPQKFPNNKWVHRMEDDIGLIREKSRGGTILWRLNKEDRT